MPTNERLLDIWRRRERGQPVSAGEKATLTRYREDLHRIIIRRAARLAASGDYDQYSALPAAWRQLLQDD